VRWIAAAVAALVVVALAAVLVRAVTAADERPPGTGAARLAPADTLVWVHVSTDPDRGAVRRATGLLERFDAYGRIRDAIVRRLAGEGARGDEVAAWLGDEAALALVDAGGTTAGSLVIAQVTDEARARETLARAGRRTGAREYKGERIDEYGGIAVAVKDGWLLIGQDPTVQGALDRAAGRGAALADDPTYRRATRDLPAARVADAYVSAAGLRRLLAPQGGLLGGLAVLLDQPGLEGVGLAAEAGDRRLHVQARSVLDAARRGQRPRPFRPELLDVVPADALAYLGVRGVSGALGNLLTAAAGGTDAGGAGPLLARLRRELAAQPGGALERELVRLFDGEVALVVTADVPAPRLSLITRVKDPSGAATLLGRLRRPLARALGAGGGAAPAWRREDAGGVAAWTLSVAGGAEVSYALFDGLLVVSTGAEGIRRIREADGRLSASDRFAEVTERRPEFPTSLGLLDFSQLLELGEQTGLNESRSYLAAREDLRKLGAVGLSSHGGEGETTSEILLSIP
jgi:hypothetical protein